MTHSSPTPVATQDLPRIIRRPDGHLLIERFSIWRRMEHLLAIITFVLLTLTGMPQKFYSATWADPMISFFGGLDKIRLIHRGAGLVFSTVLIVHIAVILVGVLRRKMRLSLLPTTQDIQDVIWTVLYYLGYKKNPPAYPKFDYRQKFEYLGMVLGGGVMAVTGLILLFPSQIFTRFSGELVLAAQVAHSNEAMLALLVLIVWHVYGAHLSPEIFPMDRSMFSGYLTDEELAERHGKEYERIFGKKPEHKNDHQK